MGALEVLSGITSAVTGLGNFGLNIANTVYGKQQADANYRMQQSVMAQNQRNLERAWEREDTAVQRRIEDIKAAGMNPLHEFGAAASQGPIKLEAPQKEYVPLPSLAESVELGAMMRFLPEQLKLLRLQQDGMAKDNLTKDLINDVMSWRNLKEITQTNDWMDIYREHEILTSYYQLEQLRSNTQFLSDSYAGRLQQLGQSVELLKNKNLESVINQEIQKRGITAADIANAKSAVEHSLLRHRLSNVDVEATTKMVALDIARITRNQAEYDLTLFKQLGIPKALTSLSSSERVAYYLGKLVTGTAGD